MENSLPILPVAENTSGAKVPCLTIKILELCFSIFFCLVAHFKIFLQGLALVTLSIEIQVSGLKIRFS